MTLPQQNLWWFYEQTKHHYKSLTSVWFHYIWFIALIWMFLCSRVCVLFLFCLFTLFDAQNKFRKKNFTQNPSRYVLFRIEWTVFCSIGIVAADTKWPYWIWFNNWIVATIWMRLQACLPACCTSILSFPLSSLKALYVFVLDCVCVCECVCASCMDV